MLVTIGMDLGTLKTKINVNRVLTTYTSVHCTGTVLKITLPLTLLLIANGSNHLILSTILAL